MSIIKYIYTCFLFLIGKAHRIQLLLNFKTKEKLRFGSNYGSKVFIHSEKLYDSVFISAGLGEDASFDIEFINKYKSTVIFIDPTPRAIKHFDEVVTRIGKNAEKNYSKTGKQPKESYDLKDINKSQLILSQNALLDKKGTVKFFSPLNKEYVSHTTIPELIGGNSKNEFINVKSNTLKNILKDLKISSKKIHLIKLDIEGAEIVTIKNILKDKIFPHQFLIEYDDLENKNSNSVARVDNCHKLLLKNGYKLVHRLYFTEFLYVNESFK